MDTSLGDALRKLLFEARVLRADHGVDRLRHLLNVAYVATRPAAVLPEKLK